MIFDDKMSDLTGDKSGVSITANTSDSKLENIGSIPIHRTFMDDESFINAVKSEFNIVGVIRKMGRSEVGSNYNWVIKHVTRLGLDTSHWKKNFSTIPAFRIYSDDELFTENSSIPRGTIKKRIIRDKLIPYKCCECDISEWKGSKLSLVLDHKNGINNDHRLENLRFLCPNCNSLTPTFTGKNVNRDFPSCLDCSKTIQKGSKRCIDCEPLYRYNNTIKKFNIDDVLLLNLIDNDKRTFTSIAKEHNVSNTAVRNRYKKIKKYKS